MEFWQYSITILLQNRILLANFISVSGLFSIICRKVVSIFRPSLLSFVGQETIWKILQYLGTISDSLTGAWPTSAILSVWMWIGFRGRPPVKKDSFRDGKNLRLLVQAFTHRWLGRWQDMCLVQILRRCFQRHIHFNHRYLILGQKCPKSLILGIIRVQKFSL